MTRFLQTGDWQLGQSRGSFSEGSAERYRLERFEAVKAAVRVARQEECRFIVVCGDAFESNQVERATVSRALEALEEARMPVYLLPGNHDPLDAGSVFRSGDFAGRKSDWLRVIEDARPLEVADGVELVGAPWLSKRPAQNPLEAVLEGLEPARGRFRVCLAHGPLDTIVGATGGQCLLAESRLSGALERGLVHYFALGDHHSTALKGPGNRACYAGSPETTDFNERDSGQVLVVEADGESVSARPVRTGRWRFIERAAVIDNPDQLGELFSFLEDPSAGDGRPPDRSRTAVRLKISGTLALGDYEALRERLEDARELLAHLDERSEDLKVEAAEGDLEEPGFSGFIGSSVGELARSAAGEDGETAREALVLLRRLAREAR